MQGLDMLMAHKCSKACLERWPVVDGFQTPYVPQPVNPESYASMFLAIDADIEQAESQRLWSVVSHLLQYKLIVIEEYVALMPRR